MTTTINDLLEVRVSVALNAIEIADGKETPVEVIHEFCLSLDEAEFEGSAGLLEEMADMIRNRLLYGWCMQDRAKVMVKSGELRKETTEEMLNRTRSDAEPRHPTNLVML